MRQDRKNKMYELYYEFPEKEFTVREIEARTRIPRATAQRFLKEIIKEGIVDDNGRAKTSLLYKIKKTNYFVEKLVASGLIEKLIDEFNPSLIVLFGSFRKGDSTKESDVDLFVESHVKRILDFKKFEKKIGHKVDLFVESDLNKLDDNLFNSVLNGIKLYGSLKIR